MFRLFVLVLSFGFLAVPVWGQTAEDVERLKTQAKELYDERRYEEALPVAERAFEASVAVHGEMDATTSYCSWVLAKIYKELQDYRSAERYYRLCVRIDDEVAGEHNPEMATSLNDLALLYERMGDYQQALPLYQRALAIMKEALGPEHPSTATSLNNLASLYRSMGDYHQALPLHKQALAIKEKTLGPEHPSTATSLNNLAALYYLMGDYEQALPLYKRALAIKEKALGPEHPSTVTSLSNLASFYDLVGDYEQALLLSKRALAITEKALGPEHPSTATCLNNLAALYYLMGDYEQALQLYKRALAIREKALGPEHPDNATDLNNLALLYKSTGDYEQALPLYERALAMREKAFGREHPDTATDLNNLAALYKSMGDYQQALPLLERALTITEQALGPEHPSTAASLNNLVGLYRLMGDYQQALPLYKRALAIYEKALGPEHPDAGTILDNLAGLYYRTGDYQQALPLYERALAIREKALGPEHPSTATSLNNLAYLQIDLDSEAEALRLAERRAASTLANTANVFTFASERQRLAYQEKQNPYRLFGTLGNAPNLIRQALRYKGLVLDSIVEDLRLAESSDDPATRELASHLKSVKGQLNQLVFNTPTSLDAEAREKRAQRAAELKGQLEDLQSRLARQGVEQGNARRAFTITPVQVQNALPPDSVLLEFLRYDHYLGRQKYEARYGAVLLPSEGKPVWAPLPGNAEDLEVQIAAYKALVRRQKMPSRFALATNAQEGDQIDASLLLPELYNKVWAPVQKALPPGTKTVVISPDGELNFVSLATLITPQDTFLAEEYNITYVSSGRDLVAENEDSPNEAHLLVGNPSFGSEVEGKGRGLALSRALDTRDLNEMNFAQLPHTLTECQGLENFYQKRKQKVTTLLDDSATEARVRKAEAPQTLHLATHGYFLPEPEANRKFREQARKPGRQEPTLPLKDPMFRSGLALTGAQTTVNLRAKGENPDMKNDGLLTAAEVGLLNLNGTKLVTLSACDTGSGESRAGEGVLGLRRGFVQAGARNLILTLWPVADKETAQLMQEFYAEADSKPAPLAMADVQRKWLMNLRTERGLSEAVRLAGPFVLSFQGRLE